MQEVWHDHNVHNMAIRQGGQAFNPEMVTLAGYRATLVMPQHANSRSTKWLHVLLVVAVCFLIGLTAVSAVSKRARVCKLLDVEAGRATDSASAVEDDDLDRGHT